jgi:hypothetical protein
MLQILKHSTLTQLSQYQISRLQKQWQENRSIILPRLIEPGLLNLVRKAIERGEFFQKKHDGVDATELSLKRDATIVLLEMMTSDPIFTDVISEITGLKPIGNFHGRVYNISKSDHDAWHQDTAFDYMMAMSINLSPKPYKGGYLQLREVGSEKLLCDIQNTGPGDALIFDISENLEHQITPVTGVHPKIAFAGWFCPKPSYLNYMSKIVNKMKDKSRMIVKAPIADGLTEPLKTALPRISESVAFRSVGSNTLLVDLGDDSQCVLNDMSSSIWESLCKREPYEKTISNLQKAYEGEAETLKSEYQEVVAELTHIGYLKPSA